MKKILINKGLLIQRQQKKIAIKKNDTQLLQEHRPQTICFSILPCLGLSFQVVSMCVHMSLLYVLLKLPRRAPGVPWSCPDFGGSSSGLDGECYKNMAEPPN